MSTQEEQNLRADIRDIRDGLKVLVEWAQKTEKERKAYDPFENVVKKLSEYRYP